MHVFLTLVWFLAGATASWVLTSLRAARTAARDRQQMRAEVNHWQSETERYKAVADRCAKDKVAWEDGCKQGRDDVITIVPMLLAAQEQLRSQDRGAPAAEMNDCA